MTLTALMGLGSIAYQPNFCVFICLVFVCLCIYKCTQTKTCGSNSSNDVMIKRATITLQLNDKQMQHHRLLSCDATLPYAADSYKSQSLMAKLCKLHHALLSEISPVFFSHSYGQHTV